MSDFTREELDDLDSALTDSLTLNELHPQRDEMAAEADAYLDRVRKLKLKIDDMLFISGSPTE